MRGGDALWCSGGSSLDSVQMFTVIAVKSGDVSGRGDGVSPFPNLAVKHELILIIVLHAWLS